eukprot:Polyplicarium_translucidae@DN1756_c0_g1_i1.p1
MQVLLAAAAILLLPLCGASTCEALYSSQVGFPNGICQLYCKLNMNAPHCEGTACSTSTDVDPAGCEKTQLGLQSESSCQARCQSIASCTSYVYDPSTTVCAALTRHERATVGSAPGAFLFGPKWCTASPTAPAPALPVASCDDLVSWKEPNPNGVCHASCVLGELPAEYCLREECFRRINMTTPAVSMPLVGAASAVGCQARCQEDPGCVAFAYDAARKRECALLPPYGRHLIDSSIAPQEGQLVYGPKWCTAVTASVPTESPCRGNTHLEVAYVQDLTATFRGRLQGVKEGASRAAFGMASHYASAKFALASFTDKPVLPLGHPKSKDYCYWLHAPLGDVAAFTKSFAPTATRSGADTKEGVMDALMMTAVDPGINWSTSAVASDGKPIRQVVVVNTNGGVHYAGDGLDYGLLPHDGGSELHCDTMDYPSVSTVGQALKAAGNGNLVVRFVVAAAREPDYDDLAMLLAVESGVEAEVVLVNSHEAVDVETAVRAAMHSCDGKLQPADPLQ